jgi:hypothetical protein
MSCPPSPGILAYLACVLAMLLADPLRIAALALSFGAALSAILLAKRRPDHRPLRILGAVWLADVLGWLLAPALASGGPFAGWLRLLQHVDSARFLVWPLALQVIVGLALAVPGTSREVARVLRTALPAFYVLMVAICVACYPTLRGEALGRFYACVQANAVIWSIVVAARSPLIFRLLSPARVVASLLVALQLLSMLAGPWWRGLFGAAYRAEQVILCVLYAAIILVQAWAWRTRGRSDPGPLVA